MRGQRRASPASAGTTAAELTYDIWANSASGCREIGMCSFECMNSNCDPNGMCAVWWEIGCYSCASPDRPEICRELDN